MSRIGKKEITLPKGVEARYEGGAVMVKGPKGSLRTPVVAGIGVKVENNVVSFTRGDEEGKSRAFHGLMRALVGNMLTGVTQGFTRQLEINGVGYKAEIKGPKIVLSLGYSHPIEYQLPDGISAKVDKNFLILSGIDRQALGAATAKIRSFRPPEPYKGKGIKYIEETVLRKAGKTAGK